MKLADFFEMLKRIYQTGRNHITEVRKAVITSDRHHRPRAHHPSLIQQEMACTLTTQGAIFRCHTQPHHTNFGLVPRIRPRIFPSTSLAIHHSPVISEAVQSVLLIRRPCAHHEGKVL